MKSICKVEGCEKRARSYGHCPMHAKRLRLYGSVHATLRRCDGQWDDPLFRSYYGLYLKDQLCEAWAKDFWAFKNFVGARPVGKFCLQRQNKQQKFSPENFYWQEKLTRKPDEPGKEWKARQWQARLKREPDAGRYPGYFRKSGFHWSKSAQIREEKLKEQDYLCKICRKEETRVRKRDGVKQYLSFDHCHATGKIRGMLCSRCNTTLGKVEDSIPLLESMIKYSA